MRQRKRWNLIDGSARVPATPGNIGVRGVNVLSDEYRKVHSAQYDSALAAPQLLDAWTEFDDGITHCIQSIFPTLVV